MQCLPTTLSVEVIESPTGTPLCVWFGGPGLGTGGGGTPPICIRMCASRAFLTTVSFSELFCKHSVRQLGSRLVTNSILQDLDEFAIPGFMW